MKATATNNHNNDPIDPVKKPILLDADSNTHAHKETTTVVSKTPSMDNLAQNSVPKINVKPLVKKLDVLKYIISTMAGKDKLAKVIKCIIDLIRIRILVFRRTDKPQKIALLWKPLFHIAQYIRSNLDISSANWVSQQLGIFRYALRFGGTPFRVIDFIKTIKSQYQKVGLDWNQWNQFLLNDKTIQDTVDIYYGIFDELNFLYKLKLLSNKTLHLAVVKHEAISWEYDILLGLKRNYKLLQENKQKQIELNVKLQTHNLLTASTSSSSLKPSTLTQEFALYEKGEFIRNAMNELKYEAKLIKLDLARLSMDLLANSSDLFHWDKYLPRGSYATLSLISGSLNIYKYWCTSQRQLQDK